MLLAVNGLHGTFRVSLDSLSSGLLYLAGQLLSKPNVCYLLVAIGQHGLS